MTYSTVNNLSGTEEDTNEIIHPSSEQVRLRGKRRGTLLLQCCSLLGAGLVVLAVWLSTPSDITSGPDSVDNNQRTSGPVVVHKETVDPVLPVVRNKRKVKPKKFNYTKEEAGMINAKQLREMISETLMELDHVIPFSEHAVELIMMTAAHESHMGTYLRQVRGPAKGIFQMEPDTEADIWKNYLKYNKELSVFINEYRTQHKDDDLQYNLKYQILMARVFYRRVPAALPRTHESMAAYAKQYWNTHLGAATSGDYYNAYQKYCL